MRIAERQTTPTRTPTTTSRATPERSNDSNPVREAMHNQTTAFFPDHPTPLQTLTPKDIEAMRAESSEDDTISPIVMADLVGKTTTYKREETLEILRDMMDEHTGKPRANKILAIIKYVPPRTGRHLHTHRRIIQTKEGEKAG